MAAWLLPAMGGGLNIRLRPLTRERGGLIGKEKEDTARAGGLRGISRGGSGAGRWSQVQYGSTASGPSSPGVLQGRNHRSQKCSQKVKCPAM